MTRMNGLKAQNGFVPHVPQKESYTQEPLAVIGLACRLPGENNSPTALWRFLERGGIASNIPPASRFNIHSHQDGSFRPKTMGSPGGMFIEKIDPQDIDAQFFKLSKVEAVAMDPQQRQLLEVVYEGLENAGITLESLDSQKFGCFVGSYASDYGDIQARDPENRATATSVGIGRAMLSNRISHFLNIKGPSMTIDTACSGSLIGLDVASRYLQTKEIDGAIVAGCNIYLSPEHVIDHISFGGTASMSGRCHTFDAKADGYIKAEAVNMVVIKRLEDALRDGDPIRAVIRGSASNSDGWTAGIASPNSEAQAAAIRQAYSNAGIIDYAATSYVECHGTGTRAGDTIEVNGVASVFSASRSTLTPLLIGSIKSNIGHSEPAAGISGLIKVILSLEMGIIPGNPTFLDPNPKINFKALKVRPSRTAITWPDVAFRRASVNSFGYGGSNAHVIVDEANAFLGRSISSHASSFAIQEKDLFAEDVIHTRPYVLVFSANDASSLESYVKLLDKHLSDPRVDLDIRDVAFTLSEKRSRHFHRGFLSTKSSNLSLTSLTVGKTLATVPRIAFVFSGQGTQWSEMGKDLVEHFPLAKSMIQHLDDVLKSLPDAPKWTLLGELSEPRSSSHLRRPEFSQPLVTALQLAILSVLKSWGIECSQVVGHSSGEIGAAVAAGHLSNEEAIKIAFYRGQAALLSESQIPVGMAAVGLGVEAVKVYLQNTNMVEIACVNSPESVTLSGDLAQLKSLLTIIQKDGYFSRLLLIDLAYHSTFMIDIAARYKELLDRDCSKLSLSQTNVTMFSSVTGRELDRACDSEYWRDNMVCPVLFNQAAQAMLSREDGPDILIEIGPSGALAGPIKQIKRIIEGPKASSRYFATLNRGEGSVRAMFDLAGQLFIIGAPISMAKVNNDGMPNSPATIVDLPNYAWNHSAKYWHEGQASKDWRFRPFPHHDLLGSKILGSPWEAPSFSKVLRVQELPWLKDHRLGENIIFPASGYVAMAVEALFQKSKVLGRIFEETQISQVSWRLRNVTFSRALVLDESTDSRVILTLNPYPGAKDSWHEFTISSSVDETTNEHCQGLVRITESTISTATKSDIMPLYHGTPASSWYKAMSDAGYSFGKAFQTQIAVESTIGKRNNRSLISMVKPESAFPQSAYAMHPVSIDGCFQTAGAAMWEGNRSAVDSVLVPAMIDECTLYAQSVLPYSGIGVASAQIGRAGRLDDPTAYKSDAVVYDTKNGMSLFQMKGFRYSRMNTRSNIHDSHSYTRIAWKPDISYISQKQLEPYLEDRLQRRKLNTQGEIQPRNTAGEVIDLIIHKNSTLIVAELNLTEQSDSIWLDEHQNNPLPRVACQGFEFVLSTNEALLRAQERYSNLEKVKFSLFKSEMHSLSMDSGKFVDLFILQLSLLNGPELIATLEFVKQRISESGLVLILGNDPGSGCIASKSISKFPDTESTSEKHITQSLNSAGFEIQFSTLSTTSKQETLSSSYALLAKRLIPTMSTTERSISIAHFSGSDKSTDTITSQLGKSGWCVEHKYLPFDDIRPASIILILETSSSQLLSNMTPQIWDAIQKLFSQGHSILWVTVGSQMEVSNPDSALIQGLMRTVRAEDPLLDLVSLDIECASKLLSVVSVDQVLQRMLSSGLSQETEAEFVERRGTLYVSRILPDTLINQFEMANTYGAKPSLSSLHEHRNCVRLISDQPGTLDALAWTEVDSKEVFLPDEFVEVDIHAASLNFKDVAIAIGLFPANEHLLGLEAGGVVRRLGHNVGSLKVGQRVVVSRKGSFANRVQAPVEAVFPLPDSVSYEDASTLPCVYFVSLYGLIDLANTQKGQTVLIHSAAGGVGIAAIQVCQYLGAEIYATVGAAEKRKFLIDTFGLTSDHIFTSRSIEFGPALMRATNGRGVDVILNSLSGDLLDESWRCIADGGTFVEIGKKDMTDKNNLSMEPFCRNASYRPIDMSLDSIPLSTIARLLSHLFQLMEEGHLRPIEPQKIFSFQDIRDAFSYMRSGNHIGKIVISDGTDRSVKVPIRPAKPTLRLQHDVSYLIVGGLKGLCGSLAMYMGRQGAKNLVVMSRSGCDDEISQGVIFQLKALGTDVVVVKGDVVHLEDVRKAFQQAVKPIAGIVQGVMLLRDKMFNSMTATEFNEAIKPKQRGTWNLHNLALDYRLNLDFFTMLSSICGVVGQTGQANYSAASSFLDAFSVYRNQLGLRACSVDLGVIEDVGYVSMNENVAKRLNTQHWTGINESLLHKIFRSSIFQQGSTPINPASATQMITGIPVPLHPDSSMFRQGVLHDARFSALSFSDSKVLAVDRREGSRDVQTLLALIKSKVKGEAALAAAIQTISRQLMKSLGMSEPMEPTKPLSGYGIDSLVAVEFRNWVRLNLGVEVTTLDVVNARTLTSLCELIVRKISA